MPHIQREYNAIRVQLKKTKEEGEKLLREAKIATGTKDDLKPELLEVREFSLITGSEIISLKYSGRMGKSDIWPMKKVGETEGGGVWS